MVTDKPRRPQSCRYELEIGTGTSQIQAAYGPVGDPGHVAAYRTSQVTALHSATHGMRLSYLDHAQLRRLLARAGPAGDGEVGPLRAANRRHQHQEHQCVMSQQAWAIVEHSTPVGSR